MSTRRTATTRPTSRAWGYRSRGDNARCFVVSAQAIRSIERENIPETAADRAGGCVLLSFVSI